MPATHYAIPVLMPAVPRDDDTKRRERAVEALRKHFERTGGVRLESKYFTLGAFETAEEAKRVAGPDDKFGAAKLYDFLQDQPVVWVTITSHNDVIRPAALPHETFEWADFLSQLRPIAEVPSDAHREFIEASGLELRELFLNLALFDVKDDVESSLRNLPWTETVDLGERRGYVGNPHGVDPVATANSGQPYALLDAVVENMNDWMAEQEHEVRKQGVQCLKSKWDELEAALNALDCEEDEAEQHIDEWMSTIIDARGLVNVEPRGTAAVAAIPFVGTEAIYITFDGITSDIYNAVPDEHYFAMLDLLQVDLREWVTYLAERAGLGQPNWDLDLGAKLNEFLAMVRFDEKTGYHWDRKVVLDALRSELVDRLLPFAGDEVDAQLEPTRQYLFDIALEVLKGRATDLDKAWVEANLPPEEKAAWDAAPTFYSSREWDQFVQANCPSLIRRPNFEMAVVNLPQGNSISYEWKNAPQAAYNRPTPLISCQSLASMMSNANYSGNLVMAFEADLDDLQSIGRAVESDAADAERRVTVRNGYAHIHCYGNGAGDGEPLQGDWQFSSKDLKEKRLRLDNDTGSSYGIQGVFGQFLASGSSLKIEVPPQPEPPTPAGPGPRGGGLPPLPPSVVDVQHETAYGSTTSLSTPVRCF